MNGINGYQASFASFQINNNFSNFGVGQSRPSLAPSFRMNNYMANSFSRGPALGMNMVNDLAMMRAQGFNQAGLQARGLSRGGSMPNMQQMFGMISKFLQTISSGKLPGIGSAGQLPRPSGMAMGRAAAPRQATLPQLPQQAQQAGGAKKGGLLSGLFDGIKNAFKGLLGGGGIKGLLGKALKALTGGGLSSIKDLLSGILGGGKGKGGGIGNLLGGLLGGKGGIGKLIGGLLGGGKKGGIGGILSGILGGGKKGGLGGILGGLLGGGKKGGIGGILGKVAGGLLSKL